MTQKHALKYTGHRVKKIKIVPHPPPARVSNIGTFVSPLLLKVLVMQLFIFQMVVTPSKNFYQKGLVQTLSISQFEGVMKLANFPITVGLSTLKLGKT